MSYDEDTSMETLVADHHVALEIGSMLSPYQRDLIRKYTTEEDTPQALRYRCLIAEAMNVALNGGTHGTPIEKYGTYQIGDAKFQLNPKSKSQFGVNIDGKPYLTTSLVDLKTNKRWKFTWQGDSIPHELLEAAVAHDKGENVKPRTLHLHFNSATIHIVGERNGQPRNDPRPNHDTNKDGEPYARKPRPHHRRVCEEDL